MSRTNPATRQESGPALPLLMWVLTLWILLLWAQDAAGQMTLFALNVPVALIAWKLAASGDRADRVHAKAKLVLDATVLVSASLFLAVHAPREREVFAAPVVHEVYVFDGAPPPMSPAPVPAQPSAQTGNQPPTSNAFLWGARPARKSAHLSPTTPWVPIVPLGHAADQHRRQNGN